MAQPNGSRWNSSNSIASVVFFGMFCFTFDAWLTSKHSTLSYRIPTASCNRRYSEFVYGSGQMHMRKPKSSLSNNMESVSFL